MSAQLEAVEALLHELIARVAHLEDEVRRSHRRPVLKARDRGALEAILTVLFAVVGTVEFRVCEVLAFESVRDTLASATAHAHDAHSGKRLGRLFRRAAESAADIDGFRLTRFGDEGHAGLWKISCGLSRGLKPLRPV